MPPPVGPLWVRLSIAIDDFGTGYSSLSYLKRLPINILKIDRAFIDGIPEDHDDVAISRAILTLGKSLEFLIVAEGVESQAHVDFLKAGGCDIAQGYFYSKPIPPEALPELFQLAKLTYSPALKGGDSCYWFSDITYYFKLPIHSRGDYLPSRSGFLPGLRMPYATVLPLNT